MSDLHPLLTVQNIKYWYWEVEPHWSVIDIAKNVGCSSSTVYRFMKKNNIPVRSRSDANFNRFQCPHKYNSFMEQRQSKEFRDSQSLIATELMQKPEIRKKLLKATKTVGEKVLSTFQTLLLDLLTLHDALFVTDVLKLVKNELQSVDSSFRHLFKRQLVKREKAINPDCFNNYKLHYRYSITEKGRKVLTERLKNSVCDFSVFLNDHRREKKDQFTLQGEFLQRENIGKNQFRILKAIQDEGSQFLVDLIPILGLPKQTIDSSLRCLSSRGFLTKEKKINPHYEGSSSCRRQYLYSITEKCPKLVEKKETPLDMTKGKPKKTIVEA